MINTQYKILNAFFIETGTAPDMASRNIMTHLTPDAMNQFGYATDQGKFLTADNLAGVAGGIIISDPNSERVVQMVNGWQTSRLRFVLRVGIPGQVNGIVYYYTGYTDYNGWSSNVKDFDPNMHMHINSILQVSQAVRHTAQGQEPYVSVIECSHLIHPANLGTSPAMWQTQFDPTQMGVVNQPTSLRPYDLMNSLATHKHASMAGDFGIPTIDSRPSIDLLKSNRINAIPSQYLSKSVESLVHGHLESHDSLAHAQPSRPFETAAARTAELNPYGDRFLNPLISEMGLNRNGFVTWSQMVALHPELHVDGVTKVNTKVAASQDIFMACASDFDTMIGDRRKSTEFFNRVMNTLPGLMLSSLIVFARFHVSNMTLDGSTQCFINDPISFVDIPSGYLMSRVPFLQEKFKQLIFNDLGLPHHMPFDAHLTVDAFGESFGTVAINGEPPVPYTMPSYADSMMSQLITPNGNVLAAMANDINHLVATTC